MCAKRYAVPMRSYLGARMSRLSKLACCGLLFYCAASPLLVSALSSGCDWHDVKQSAGDSRITTPYKFVVDSGWEIPGLKNAILREKRTDRFGREIWVYKIEQDRPYIGLQMFKVDSSSNAVHLVPGSTIEIDTIWEYRIQGRVYQYAVGGASTGASTVPIWPRTPPKPLPPNAQLGGILGCGTTIVRYTDQDGDGIFETLQYESLSLLRPRDASSSDLIPDWALQLVPKKEELLKVLRSRIPTNVSLDRQGENF
jgi:hypothetical protein